MLCPIELLAVDRECIYTSTEFKGVPTVSLHRKIVQVQRTKSPNSRGASCGFSLIEVLVASTVFSLGLAGFTALLLSSIISSAEARRDGIAAMAAASLSEQLRLNPLALDRYLDPPETVALVCNGDISCTPEQKADYDFKLWQLELADNIQNARGLICRDGTPTDGVNGDTRCDGSGPLVIKIFWRGQGTDESDESKQHRYTLEVS